MRPARLPSPRRPKPRQLAPHHPNPTKARPSTTRKQSRPILHTTPASSVQGVPICTLSKTSTTRVLVAFLTSRMKKPTRSCGKRAPRQVIRAGSGGDTGGERVIVIQAGRRTCSAAAQRLVHLACRGSTPAHGSLYSKLAKQVGQFLRTRAGAHLHPGSHSRYRKVGKGRVRMSGHFLP